MNEEQWRDDEDQEGSGFLNFLPLILWQRRWLVIVPLVLCAIAGVSAALLLPTVYRSSATLLVQSQELPEEVVGSPVTNLIDQRIAKIRQQVLSRGDLIELIQQNKLYEEERQSKPISEIVEEMRSSTSIQAVSADIGQRQGAATTIAFSMSFDYRDAVKAQLVMQSFVDRFLELDATDLAEQAGTTVEFLNAQAKELQSQIAAIEGQITSVKAQNGSALASAGLSTMANPGSYDAQIAALQRDNAVAMEQARSAPKHPTVLAAEAQLAGARAIYAETHPDVVFARQRLEQARRLAAENPNNDAQTLAQAQIEANNRQIAALGRLRAAEAARSSSVSAAQARAPVVMETVAQLENRAMGLRTQYQDVSTRLLAARNSEKMATEDKGERLSVTDPPQVPEEPMSPNRPMLILGGIAAGLLGGFVLAMIAELVFRPIRGVAQVEKITGAAPLVVIPTLHAEDAPTFLERMTSWLPFGRRASKAAG